MKKRSTLLALVMMASLLGATGSADAQEPTDYTYVTMSDGIKIAISVRYPPDFSHDDEGNWPAMFQYDGYGGGGSTLNPGSYGNRYVTVKASIRGTGCSGGRFDLFDRRHAIDGYDIIENWIVKQKWSNGDVGLTGHSYYGLSGFLVAAMNPPHLRASAVSGLIDDLYRGIVYPGGVPNYGFPAFWTGAYRPFSETSQNAGRYASETFGGDPTCLANIASRPPRDPLDDPILQGLTSQEDDAWWAARALSSYIDRVGAPMHIIQQYQDEQTGPRGGHWLWEHLPEGLPKRLVLTNGVHSTNSLAHADRRAWLDCWVIDHGQGCGDITDPDKRVRIHFETKGTGNGAFLEPLVSSDFPLPETEWTRYYLGADGKLATSPTQDGSRSYLSSVAGRQMTADAGFGLGDNGIGRATFVEGPDEARWEVDFGRDTALAGPIVMDLWATSTAPDTDFYVDVLDVDTATGAVTYLQRGMLRASHRAIDELRSDRIKSGPLAGTIYRPHRPHTNPQPIIPLEANNFLLEIFPVGHVFREGHKLVISMHAPPPTDALSIYAWVSGQPPAENSILQENGMRSSILLPILPALPPMWDQAPRCGELVGNPCFVPVL